MIETVVISAYFFISSQWVIIFSFGIGLSAFLLTKILGNFRAPSKRIDNGDSSTTSSNNGKDFSSKEILTERPENKNSRKGGNVTKKPISVNYHLTRKCNYECGFCFHTAKTSNVLPIEEAKRGLQMLKDAGMEKVNFAGGEPFIVQRGKFVGELVKYCKVDLSLPSVTIVSNGSLVTEAWFVNYGEYLDILAVSCDSFLPEVNKKIGRQQGQRDHLKSLKSVRDLCYKYQVAFKLNTVVNTYNKDENMVENILKLSPCRWKVFQCLLIAGENVGDEAIRHAESYVVSDEEFKTFLERHKQVKCLVPESNEMMRNSYLLLDEYMRFLDCSDGGKKPSRSLLDVGVAEALKFSGFDQAMFFKRGGKYKWSKADMDLEW